MQERRRQGQPKDAEGYLRSLPALELLHRLPTPMLGVEMAGRIAFANPAFADLLGYVSAKTVTRLYLPELLTGYEALEPFECVDRLRTDTAVVEWNHSQEHVIRTMLSPPLLVRETDTLLLVGVTDVTAWLWETNRCGATLPRVNQPGPLNVTERIESL